MLVSMSKWMALGVLGTTFSTGLAAGWVIRRAAPVREVRDACPAYVPPPPVEAPVPVTRPGKAAAGAVIVRPTPTPGAYVRLGASDTLGEISKKAYGTARRVGDLQKANPGIDPQRLRPGTLLYVPMGSEIAPTALSSELATSPSPAGSSRSKTTLASPATGR